MEAKIIATNRKAHHDYTVFESFEAGIQLKGTEVKSLREGKANLKDSFARIENGEGFVFNLHISPYEFGNRFNVDPQRTRKLLVHKQEILRLIGQVSQKGFTLIPLKMYFKGGLVKIEIAVCKGKKLFDKRESIKRKEVDLEMKRALSAKRRQ